MIMNRSALFLFAAMATLHFVEAGWDPEECINREHPNTKGKYCWVCHGTAAHEANPYTSNCVAYNSIGNKGTLNGHADETYHNDFPNHNKYNDMIWCPEDTSIVINDDTYVGLVKVDPSLETKSWPTFEHGVINPDDPNCLDPDDEDNCLYKPSDIWSVEQCQIGRIDGDPHIQGWDGEWYDYHGECDLVYITAPDFADGKGLTIHVRTKIRYEYSQIEAAAIRIGGDVFEFGGWGDYMLNGVSNAEMPNKIGGFDIRPQEISKTSKRFYIHISSNEKIEVKNFKDIVSVRIIGPTMKNFGKSLGMLGDFGQGRKLGRDGETVFEDMNAFGQEWQVLGSEPKLFETDRAPQHPEQCRMPEPKAQQRRLGYSVAEKAARAACADWGDAIEQCVYDVLAFGDLEYAKAGAF